MKFKCEIEPVKIYNFIGNRVKRKSVVGAGGYADSHSKNSSKRLFVSIELLSVAVVIPKVRGYDRVIVVVPKVRGYDRLIVVIPKVRGYDRLIVVVPKVRG